ncbi:MAG: sulfotransferase family 2 domain-containing protein [Acidimicrobiales bacterium]
MISRAHRCIFVHQRKCAGMSVIETFGVTPDEPDFHFANDGVLAPEWTSEAELVEGCFTFAVVRNPWDRFVSGWMYCRSTRKRSLVDVLRDPPPRGHDFRHVTRGQCATIYRPDGVLAVDHLIRHEELDRRFAEVCEIIGRPRVELPRINLGDRPHYRQVFDDDALRMFERRYAEDIDRLGYSY